MSDRQQHSTHQASRGEARSDAAGHFGLFPDIFQPTVRRERLPVPLRCDSDIPVRPVRLRPDEAQPFSSPARL